MIKKNRVFQLFMILFGMVLTSCSKDDDAIKYNDEYQGGIVFYIFQEGDVGFVSGETHGLIVSFEDLQTSTGKTEVAWGCCNDGFDCLDIPEAENDEIGSGKSNTEAILNACDEIDIAARLCDDYSKEYNGVVYDDWYLPSYMEMSYMNNHGLEYIIDHLDFYWTSSQYEYDETYVAYGWVDGCNAYPVRGCWSIRTDGGARKNSKYKVRAVRNF